MVFSCWLRIIKSNWFIVIITSNSRRGGRSGVLEIYIYSFWGTCSPPCARPCAFILFISFDFPFISFSFLFFNFFFTFIFFFIFPFSFHRHHHRQAGALAGAVDVEDLAVILKCPFLFHSLLFYLMQRKRKRNATQRSAIRPKSFPKFFRNSSEIGGPGGVFWEAPEVTPQRQDQATCRHISNGSRTHFSVLDQRD